MKTTRVEISSSNYGGANLGRKFVIVHANGATVKSTIAWFQNVLANVSYHYLVSLRGEVFQFVDENERAWHAGLSAWGGERNLNDLSVGVSIESLEGTQSQVTEAQYTALLELIRDIQARHNIKTEHVLGHKEVSPGRKVDPIHIDMNELRRNLAGDERTGHIDTLVLHGFSPDMLVTLDGDKVTLRGNMVTRARGNKLDVRLEANS